MNLLLVSVLAYLVVSILIGLYAARRVKTTADYALAGRSLSFPVVIATTFATWFGAETVLGVSATFAKDGLKGVVEDPFGSSMCLVLVGLFFAGRLYRMNLMTIGDYYRQRYGKTIELLTSVIIVLSYMGWVAAQIKALGLVFNILAPDMVSPEAGMVIGTAVVLFYTLFGGMFSVAMTDFFQMIVIGVGLIVIAVFAAQSAGGFGVVMDAAASKNLLTMLPSAEPKEMLFFFAAAITLMLGSIPQQDVFQRVMSSKNETIATRGPIFGGLLYLVFAFIPMFVVVAALKVTPDVSGALLEKDAQQILPTFIMTQMPLFAQIMFFGALLSAIMSTASATILAPSTTLVENVIKNFVPKMSDATMLKTLRATVLLFALAVLLFALNTSDSIYEMVKNAYKVTLVGAFVPLVMGLFWKRSTSAGALASIVMGIGTWLVFERFYADAFPAQLAGLMAAFAAIVVVSLLGKNQPSLVKTP
jgi:solute:Na+ symporter, SSS family